MYRKGLTDHVREYFSSSADFVVRGEASPPLVDDKVASFATAAIEAVASSGMGLEARTAERDYWLQRIQCEFWACYPRQ